MIAARKDVARGLVENRLVFSGDPNRLDNQLAAIDAAASGHDPGVKDGAHPGARLGFYGVGVIPEIEAVHVSVVEPKARVVRVVDTFVGAGIERIAAGDGDALVCDERKEDGFLERRGPDVGGERCAVDGDVDAAMGLVGSDLHTTRTGWAVQ